MEKSSSMARQAGVSYQDLASYITVVSSITRQSGETIGQAFKTIFARMEQVKAGADIDAEGESINNVEKVLLKQGITLRDTNQQFRDMSDVLADVAARYQELGAQGRDVEQAQILGAIAGVRQVNMLSALFQNWDEVTKAQDIAANSMGATNDKYQIYLNSIEAAANKSKASWEAVWQTTINNDVIKFFYNLSAGVGDLVNDIGGLIPVVSLLAGAFLSLNFKNIVSGLSSAGASVKAFFTTIQLGAAATATEIAVATAGISLLIAAIVAIAISIGDASKKLEEASDKLRETNQRVDELTEKKKSILELSDAYKTLANNTSKSTDEQKKFTDIQNQLKDLLPQIAGYYDQSGNFILDPEALSTNQAYLDILQKQIDAEKELASIQAGKVIKAGQQAYEEASRTIGVATTEQPMNAMGAEGFYAPTITDEEIAQAQAAMASLVATAYENYAQLDEASKDIFELSLQDMGEYGQEVLKLINSELSDTYRAMERSRTDGILAQNDTISANEDEIASAEDLAASSESLSSAMDAVTKATAEQAKEGQISNATALDLISSNADLAMYLIQTADGYIFDAEAARAATQAELINEFTKYGLRDAAIAAANGNYILANSMLVTANLAAEETARLQGLLKTFAAMNVKISIASGGGSGISAQEKLNNAKKEAYQQEIKAINAQKKASQDQIKALEDKKDAYNDIIDAQKESLRLTKEEDEYQKELADKNKELSDIERELLQIQFDDSEEANARRLELEEQRAEKTADIAEYQADRTYDIQIDALDREAEAYEEMIDMQIAGIQMMINGYDAVIAKINEMIDALSKVASAGGGAGSGYTTPTTKSVVGPTGYDYSKTTIGAAESAAKRDLNGNGIIGFDSGGTFETTREGLIRVHPEEVGAILNKKEISSAAPLASFFSSIMKGAGQSPRFSNNNSALGGINVGDMIFNVAGNLDKTNLPVIKEMIMKTITDATRNTGTLRNAKSFTV